MNSQVRIVNKRAGQTPLDCINEIKKTEPDLVHLPLTYAGRLDPLAEGVLIILIGDECMKKDEYLKLSKEYEVEILFGFETDTYDVMGKVKASPAILFERSSEEGDGSRCQTIPNSIPGFAIQDANFSKYIEKILPQFTGRIKQSYPPYSSRTVNGKPLFQWSREDKIDEIKIPTRDVFIEKIEIIKENFISGGGLLSRVKKDISQVNGDFRQSEIIILWENVLEDKKEEEYKTITLRISCGSGVYVRGLAHEIGISLGVPALALKIKRTKVGNYFL